VCVSVYIHVRMYACVYVSVYVCVYASVCVCVCVYLTTLYLFVVKVVFVNVLQSSRVY
jgi:hypothetical protein